MTTTHDHDTYTTGLRTLADLIDGNPHLYDDVRYSLSTLLIPVSSREDPRGRMADWIRVAKSVGLPISKSYDESWGKVVIDFGGFALQVYADRDQVCERVVVGTREVTREVPDPVALAIPTTTVTEVVEDVRWECLPLLTPADAAAVSA